MLRLISAFVLLMGMFVAVFLGIAWDTREISELNEETGVVMSINKHDRIVTIQTPTNILFIPFKSIQYNYAPLVGACVKRVWLQMAWAGSLPRLGKAECASKNNIFPPLRRL